MRILIVEDEPKTGAYLRKGLTEAGYVVDWVEDGITGQHQAETEEYDLLVLDVMLPGQDGWTLLQNLRRSKSTPVLFLTARDDVGDRVKGLELGADDYLAKPFELTELEARARALIRRSLGHEHSRVECGPLSYDSIDRSFHLAGEPLSLTPRERSVLEVLIMRNGRAINKETLSEKIFGLDESVNADAIEIYVYRLRKKLENTGVAIVTLRGLGYLLEARAEAAE